MAHSFSPSTAFRLLAFVVLLSSLRTVAWAQGFDAGKLGLTWEVVEAQYQGKPQLLAALTITNNSGKPLPATGWKVYFNYGRTMSDVKGEVAFEFLNGDFYRLMPEKGFKEIQPGQSHRIAYVASGRAVNFRDAPSGFYLVWDSDPAHGVAITDYIIKPLATANFDGHMTAGDIFQRNKVIQDIPEQELVKVFPSPVTYQPSEGTFKLNAKVSIAADPAFANEAKLLASDLAAVLGTKPRIGASKGTPGITLKKIAGLEKEAYELQVTPKGIILSASEPAGAFYAIQSLKTLLPPDAWAAKQKALTIPAVQVSDAPRFGYRAFMLDVARNFQPKEQVLKVLDLMALYKLNVLHFHLNDDEGWRLEIPGLPELTEVGARRGHTLDSKVHLPASYGSGPEANKAPGSGYYSKADFMEILRYATARHIRVIPEVETPGHARAALRSMDARYEKLMKAGRKAEAAQYMLRDVEDQSVYRSIQNWDDNVINVALPSTYTFLEKVVDEIVGMYREAGAPLATIHFGGDEVPAGVWEKSPAVQALQKENPQIKSVEDLWSYYFSKVNQILQKRNLYLSGWEEIALQKTELDGKTRYVPNPRFTNENFHAYVWNNVWGWGNDDLAYRLANAGYKTILAAATNFYFDMAYYQDFEELGTYWATFSDLDAPFSFVPFDYYKTAKDRQGKPIDKTVFAGKERLTEYGKSNIVGLQCLIWTETIRSGEQLEYMLAPRLLAFAERAWAKEPAWAAETDSIKAEATYHQAWSQFVSIAGKRELRRLDTYAGGFLYRIPTAGALVENGKVYANVQLPGFQIRYTTDGTEPTAKSKLYTNPIMEKATVKLRVFNAVGRGGRTISIANTQNF